jgi:cysteinyl-tRNA synthetase
LAAFERVAGVLDVLPTPKVADPALASWVAERLAARNQARKSKDFKAADAIRDELRARGVEIEDTPQGTKWRVA